MSAMWGFPYAARTVAEHSRSRMPVCSGLYYHNGRDLRINKAHAVNGNRKGKADSDEVLFDVDKGWSPNADELAQQIQTAIEDSQEEEYSSSVGGEGADQILFSTAWEDEVWSEEVSGGVDVFPDDGSDGEDDLTADTWLDAGWSVSVVEPDAKMPTVSEGHGLDELDIDADSIQTSNRQLQRELTAPDGQRQSDPAAAAEDALASLRPHDVKRIQAEQADALENEKMMTPAERKKRQRAKQRHTRLQIIAGTAAGKRLYSPAGEQVRPMMEKVRGALFSMLLSGTVGRSTFPQGARWLDLFAGTGAVGLEGLSRGCAEGHFVEMDSWVIGKCLNPNVEASGLTGQAIVHQSSVEDFLRRSLEVPSFAGGAFDYISVTPPYMMVSYTELYDLLDKSALVHDTSIVIVEYAAQNKPEVRQTVGPLQLVKSRRYGRTFLALYANTVV